MLTPIFSFALLVGPIAPTLDLPQIATPSVRQTTLQLSTLRQSPRVGGLMLDSTQPQPAQPAQPVTVDSSPPRNLGYTLQATGMFMTVLGASSLGPTVAIFGREWPGLLLPISASLLLAGGVTNLVLAHIQRRSLRIWLREHPQFPAPPRTLAGALGVGVLLLAAGTTMIAVAPQNLGPPHGGGQALFIFGGGALAAAAVTMSFGIRGGVQLTRWRRAIVNR